MNPRTLKKMNPLHPWKVSVEEAIQIQENLRGRIILKNRLTEVKIVAGADVAYSKDGTFLSGAIVVLSHPEMKPLDSALATGEVSFPYIPGLFSFREGPVLLEAFNRLKLKPDLILFDGHGIAHPKQFGLASHLGLWLDLPSIGCARTSLLDDYEPPGPSQGDFSWVYWSGKKVGAVLRTRKGVRPVFVSPGHRVDLQTSLRVVLHTCKKYRIPEPLRRAHQMARRFASQFQEKEII